MRHDPTFWLIARASGLLAYALVTATVVAGLTVKTRLLRSVRLASVTDIHRFLSLTALLAVGGHVVALVLDETINITPLAVVVPGLVPYRTLWSAFGVAALELMALIHVSFRLRKRIGVTNWRRLHYATYLVFAGATIHGLLTGTDSSRLWALGIYAVAMGLVISLTVWRIDSARAKAAAKAANKPVRPAVEARRPRPPSSAGEERQPNLPHGVVPVRVDQANALPRPEPRPPRDHRHRERRTDDRGKHVVGPVPR